VTIRDLQIQGRFSVPGPPKNQNNKFFLLNSRNNICAKLERRPVQLATLRFVPKSLLYQFHAAIQCTSILGII
jgi:hypothetical protein